jgi:hypothetical protein
VNSCIIVAAGGLLALILLSAAPASQPVFAQVTASYCPDARDADADGDSLPDSCELQLARQFAPVLTVGRVCNWDGVAPRPGGGYFYAVQPVGTVIRVAYLPAYFDDCGWSGVKCRVPMVDCSPHAGDSEFIAVEISVRQPGAITVTGVFLSAHCFGRSGKNCRWYRGSELSDFEWQDGAPIIWVADGRNANYPTQRACDKGHHSLDTCDNATFRSRFPVNPGKNIGSRKLPAPAGGCIKGEQLRSSLIDPAAIECFWNPAARFRGWRSGAPGVTGYHRYLTEIAGF